MMVADFATVQGCRTEVLECGAGRPLLFLDSGFRFEPATECLEILGESFHVIAPSHPGFGQSERGDDMRDADDLAYFYLDFLKQRNLRDSLLVGISFGAWIAAEIAIKSTDRLSGLVLANPVGIKVSGRETRDIADIFAMTDRELLAALFADPPEKALDIPGEPEALRAARSRETLARYGWSPYMHDPKLFGRLHRIDVDALVVRGTADKITGEPYTRAFCDALPSARYVPMGEAGHLPHVEKPQQFAEIVAQWSSATLATAA